MGKSAKTCGPPPVPAEPEGGKPGGFPLDDLLTAVGSRFPETRVCHNRCVGEPVICVSPSNVLDVARFLRTNDFCSFDFCRSVTGTDRIERYEIVYNLARLPKAGKDPSEGFVTIALIVHLTDLGKLSTFSLTEIWPGVDFQEREIFDMLGVAFIGHPDLRRILLDDAFIGHPLRKDYPLTGKWDDMLAVDANLDDYQVRTIKENSGLTFSPEDVPPDFKR
jgi:NADH-quinone oxidoreductase subunit C